MTPDEVRQALLHLTLERKRTVEASTLLTRLFAGQLGDNEPTLSFDELEQTRKDLEDVVPGYHIWFEPRHTCYVLVPKLDREVGQ
jgi:hypothetical protein